MRNQEVRLSLKYLIYCYIIIIYDDNKLDVDYWFLLQDGNDFGENYSDLQYVMTEVSYVFWPSSCGHCLLTKM